MTKFHHIQLENHCYHTISTTADRSPVFSNPELAMMVLDTIQFIRRDKAQVLAFALMPDHLHFLVVPKPPFTISQVMQSTKGYSSRVINKVNGVKGKLWQQGFYDRVIRDEEQLNQTIAYIHENPVKAGLCLNAAGYQFSSAWPGAETDLAAFLDG